MKRITNILVAVILFIVATPMVLAATATPSATKKPVDTKIEDLKERLATKVAELRKTTPKAIFGTVSQVTVSTLTVDTQSKAVKIELTDDIEVFQMLKGKRTTLSTDDVDKNDNVTIFGDYDATLDVLQAKRIFIEAATMPKRIHGFITQVDKKTNSLTIKGLDEATYTVDIETTTKTNMWTKAKGIEKSGFSKLETGMFISVLGVEDPKKPTTFTANRLLHVITKAAAPTTEPTPSKTASVSGTKKPTPTP